MAKTKIEWTEETWNPTTGCTQISPGCDNCYAQSMAKRLYAIGNLGYKDNFEFSTMPERLNKPNLRIRSTMYLVNSMSDIFHHRMPDDFLNKIMDTIKLTPQHTYQLLTKRGNTMASYFLDRPIPKNVWLGVTVEDKEHGIPRIDSLRYTKASIKFLSIEPLLEDIGEIDLSNIDWVIVGGESGGAARQMKKEWVLNIKEQCEKQGVLFFFKQWGVFGEDGKKKGKKANGRLLDGREWNDRPSMIPKANITLTASQRPY